MKITYDPVPLSHIRFFFLVEYIQSKSAAQLETAFCILSNCASVWLAYILFIVLEDVCVVCISMYVINFSLLIGSFMRFGELAAQSKKKK